MRLITGIIFWINAALWGGITIALFVPSIFDLDNITPSLVFGVPFAISTAIFFISWALVEEVTLSPFDYFMCPEWDIFTSKLKWSNSNAITSLILIYAAEWFYFDIWLPQTS